MTREDVIKKFRQKGESKADSSSLRFKKEDVVNAFRQSDSNRFSSIYDEGINAMKQAYGGWNSQEDMATLKTTMQNAYTKMTNMGMGSSAFSNEYKQFGDALGQFDGTAKLYSDYLNADAFDTARRKAELDNKYKGSSYKAIADALKTAQGDERDYLSTFTDYGTTKDYEEALRGAQGSYKQDLQKAMENHKLMNPLADYESFRENPDFAQESTKNADFLKDMTTGKYKDVYSLKGKLQNLLAMDDDTLAMAQYIYNTQGAEAFSNFINQTDIQVNKQNTDRIANDWANWTNQNALTGTVGTLGNFAMSALMKVPTTEQAIVGTLKGDFNPYAGASGAMRVKNASQSALSQSVRDVNPALGIGYDALTTGIESRIGQRLFGAPYNVIMGGEAYAQAYADALENGADRETATEKAFVTGAIETLTEQIGMEWAFGKGKSAIGTVVKQFFAEGSEELVGDVANLIYDYVRNHDKSEFNQNVQQYMSLGYSEEEATKKAVIDQALETGRSFVVAGLSAGAEGGVHEAYVAHKGSGADAQAMQEALKGSNNKEYLRLMEKYEGDLSKMTDWEKGNLYRDVVSKKPKTLEQYSEQLRTQTAFTQKKAEINEDLKSLYEENKNGNENAYDANFELVTQFAKQGYSLEETLNAVDTNVMKASVASEIYNKVREQVATEAQSAKLRNDKVIENFKGNFKKGKMDVSAVDMNNLTKNEKTIMGVLNLWNHMGVNITVFSDDSAESVNGFVDGDGTIHINLKARIGKSKDTADAGQYAISTLAHESTHFMSSILGDEFESFKGLVRNYMTDVTFKDMAMKQIANAKKNGRDIEMAEAEEEVVARFCEDMLNDGTVVEKLCKDADESTIKRIIDAIRKWFTKVSGEFKKLMAGYKSGSEEARLLAESQKAFEAIQKEWTEMFERALKVNSASKAEREALVEKAIDAIKEGDTKVAEEIVGKVENTEKDSFKLNDDLGKKTIDFNNNKGKKNDGNVHGLVDPLVLSNSIAQRKSVAWKMAKYLNLLPQDIEGNIIVSNSSYSKSVEHALICVRSLVNEWFVERVANEVGRPLTAEEQIVASEILAGKVGNQRECQYCYVAMDRRSYRASFGRYLEAVRDLQKKVEDNKAGYKKDYEYLSKHYNELVKVEKKKRNKYVKDNKANFPLFAEYLDGREMSPDMIDRYMHIVNDALNGGVDLNDKDFANDENRVKALNDPKIGWYVKDSIAWGKGAIQPKNTSRTIKVKGVEMPLEYIAYNGSILKMSQEAIEKLNEEYGLRLYSFSDYVPAFLLEDMQVITDASVRGLKMLAYTKDSGFVRVFAPSGININMSVYGVLDSAYKNDENLNKLREAYKAEQNDKTRKAYLDALGKYVMKDEMQGSTWEEVQELRNEHPNVGAVFVATNDDLVEWAIAQDWIDVVIPFHTVRAGLETKEYFGYTNYKSSEGDKKTAEWDEDNGDLKEIPPTLHNNNLEDYEKALKANHLTHRFPQWVGNPNYMKLVNETRLAYNESQPVQPVFGWEYVDDEIERIKNEGKYGLAQGVSTEEEQERTFSQEFKNAVGLIKEGKTSKEDLEKFLAGDKKYSTKISDEEYSRLAKENPEEARKVLDEVARERGAIALPRYGNPTHFYHSTFVSDFNVFDINKARVGRSGLGFYFSPEKDFSQRYGFNTFETYLFPQNLAPMGKRTIDEKQLKDFYKKIGVSEESDLVYASRLSHVRPFSEELKEFQKGRYARIDTEEYLMMSDDKSIMVDLQMILNHQGVGNNVILYLLKDTFGYDGLTDSVETVVWDYNAIRSADLITYDDYGREIPLSERFDPLASGDIRYSEKMNVGYHAGDLGKTEHLQMQGSGRGTGHFGSGTYFVGDEEEINDKTYGKRPHEKVDFSKYKLHRPRNLKEGLKLHDFLKIVDGGLKEEWVHAVTRGDFWLVERDKLLGTDYDNDDYWKTSNQIKLYQQALHDIGGEYQDETEYLESIGYTDINADGATYHGEMDGKPYEEHESRRYIDSEYFDEYLKKVFDARYKEINDEYREFANALTDAGINYYTAFNGWQDALRKVLEYQKTHNRTDVNANRMDSYATVFMKALGYEGVDVRGIKGLDDTKYGSVIYDLKDEDLARKQEIGTARWSEKLNPEMIDVLKTNKALEKQNKVLKDDVARLRKLISLEKQITKGKVLNDNKLKAVAEVLLKEANSTYDKQDLINRLRDAYGLIRNDDKIDWDTFMGQVKVIASELVRTSKPTYAVDDHYKAILKTMRDARIRLSDEQKAQAKEAYGDEWRKFFLGKVVFVNDGKNLDEYWAEWSKANPEAFGELSMTELAETYDRVKQASYYMEDVNTEQATKDLAELIYQKFWNVPAVETTADKYNAEIRQLKALHKEAMKDLRDAKDAEIAEIRKHKNDVIAEVRRQKNERFEEYRQYRNQKEATIKDFAQRKATINKIYSTIDTLKTWMEKNSAKEHVPEMLKPTVTQLIRAIDFSSRRLKNLNGGTDSTLKSVTANREVSMRLALERLNEIANNLSTEEGMQALMTYIDLPPQFAQDVQKVYKVANDIALKTGNDNEYILYSMSLEDLDNLLKVVRATKNAVVNLNQTIAGAQKYRISEQAQKDILANNSMKAREKNGLVKRFLEWTNALPEYAFEHLGEGAYTMFTQVKDGWDTFSFNINEILDFVHGNGKYEGKGFTGKEVKDWESHVHEVEVRVVPTDAEAKRGGEEHTEKVKLTDAQLMSIYCLSKREHAKTHFAGKGIRVGTFSEGKKEVVQVKNIRLSETELDNLIGLLTDRQRQVADNLQEFMNTVCSEWGNEISMKRFGIKGFTEKNYFPITVDSNALESDPRKNEKSIYALLNMSFTKPIQPRATATMEIASIFDTFTTHTTEMAKYNALALPVLDLIKYYNYSETDNEGNEFSVKKSIESAFGTQAKTYVNHFLQDLNGMSERGRGDSVLKSFTRAYKTASVAGNLQVALLQPIAYLRATAVLEEKYLLASLAMPHKNKQARKEMLKYSGIANWKKRSLFDTNVSKGLDSEIKQDKTWYDKAIDISMKGAEVADELTWGALWNACKIEVRTKQGLKDEELMKATALRFRDVIYKTQVIDSTMTRTDLMRDSSTATQWITSFMSEPSVTMNVLQDVGFKFAVDKRKYGKAEALKRNGKALGKALEAYLLSTVAESILRTIVGKYRHPDKDEEEMRKDLMSQFISNVNPLANLPIMRDLMSIIQGYDVTRMDMATFQDAYKAYEGWKKFLEGSDLSYTTIFNTAKSISELTGIPISSLMREVKTVIDNVEEYK